MLLKSSVAKRKNFKCELVNAQWCYDNK